MAAVRKVVLIASSSGNGKTTLGRELARRRGLPFVEMDALVHGAGWVEKLTRIGSPLASRLAALSGFSFLAVESVEPLPNDTTYDI